MSQGIPRLERWAGSAVQTTNGQLLVRASPARRLGSQGQAMALGQASSRMTAEEARADALLSVTLLLGPDSTAGVRALDHRIWHPRERNREDQLMLR